MLLDLLAVQESIFKKSAALFETSVLTARVVANSARGRGELAFPAKSIMYLAGHSPARSVGPLVPNPASGSERRLRGRTRRSECLPSTPPQNSVQRSLRSGWLAMFMVTASRMICENHLAAMLRRAILHTRMKYLFFLNKKKR